MSADLLTSAQVVGEAGITFRILDYWVRSGVLEPAVEAAGSGSRRLYFPEQASMVRILGRIQASLSRSGSGVSTVLLAEVYDAMERGECILDLGDDVHLTWSPK